MTLPQYLEAQNLTQAQFARLVGTSQGTVSKLCSPGRRPGWGMAVKIERATGGKVPVAIWAHAEGSAA